MVKCKLQKVANFVTHVSNFESLRIIELQNYKHDFKMFLFLKLSSGKISSRIVPHQKFRYFPWKCSLRIYILRNDSFSKKLLKTHRRGIQTSRRSGLKMSLSLIKHAMTPNGSERQQLCCAHEMNIIQKKTYVPSVMIQAYNTSVRLNVKSSHVKIPRPFNDKMDWSELEME